MHSLTIQATDIRSSQQWTSDPDMIEMTISHNFLEKAKNGIAFMQVCGVEAVQLASPFNFEFYTEAEGDTEVITGQDGINYAVFEPQYRIETCHALIFKHGLIRAVFTLKHEPSELWTDVGTIDDLQAKFADNTAVSESPTTANIPTPLDTLCERLTQYSQTNGVGHDPAVLKDASASLQRLSVALHATQHAMSDAMQYAEKADKFVAQIANMTVWGFPGADGKQLNECDPPSSGFEDSHESLMNLILIARDLLKGNDHE